MLDVSGHGQSGAGPVVAGQCGTDLLMLVHAEHVAPGRVAQRPPHVVLGARWGGSHHMRRRHRELSADRTGRYAERSVRTGAASIERWAAARHESPSPEHPPERRPRSQLGRRWQQRRRRGTEHPQRDDRGGRRQQARSAQDRPRVLERSRARRGALRGRGLRGGARAGGTLGAQLSRNSSTPPRCGPATTRSNPRTSTSCSRRARR